MTWSDPIVDEVRRARDAYAARFNYDLRAIYRDLKDQEKRSGLKFVSFAPDGSVIPSAPEAGIEPKEALQSTVPATAVSQAIPTEQAGSGG